MKILFTTDGSRYALSAARALAAWFPSRRADVDLLAVTPDAHTSMHVAALATRGHETQGFGAASGHKRMRSGRPAGRGARKERHGAAGRSLESAARVLASAGLRVRPIVREGDPAAIVLEQAASKRYDLIVVGAKGRGEAPFLRPGSVTGALLDEATVPVLMVRSPSTRRRRPTAQHPLRVLITADGSPESERAAERTAALFRGGAARARVLAVAADTPGRGLGRRRAGLLARDTAERLRARGLAAEPEPGDGDPVERIEEAARASDLVVVAARSAGLDGDRAPGSVSLAVARAAPCSVLLFRDGPPRAAGRAKRSPPAEAGSLEVALRRVQPTADVALRAARGTAALQKVAAAPLRTRLTVGKANGRRRKGDLYDVRLEVGAPGERVEVSHTPGDHRQDEGVLTALDEAYAKARRTLVERRRKVNARRNDE